MFKDYLKYYPFDEKGADNYYSVEVASSAYKCDENDGENSYKLEEFETDENIFYASVIYGFQRTEIEDLYSCPDEVRYLIYECLTALWINFPSEEDINSIYGIEVFRVKNGIKEKVKLPKIEELYENGLIENMPMFFKKDKKSKINLYDKYMNAINFIIKNIKERYDCGE